MKTSLHVTLLSYTPDPEKTVAGAAKLCYSSSGVEDLYDGLTAEKTEDFLHMLMGLGHQSPIEHASFTFGVEGVSRALLAQLTRHRIAAYSVKSQRYVTEGQFSYVVPPEIEGDKEATAIFLKSMEDAQAAYDRITALLEETHAAALMKEGQGEKEARRAARKKAIEDARFVLPNACETKLVMTMNARSLFNFFEKRCCTRAQWEIRALATEMLRLCRGAAPVLFRTAGPPCLTGPCAEGRMTCGHMDAVRAKFKALS